MSLNMQGHIDNTFRSIKASRIKQDGSYVDGLPVKVDGESTPHTVTVQPLSDREINYMPLGGRRISDFRKIYVNDGLLAEISEADDWEMNANGRGNERYETVSMDNRPWRNYCKIVVVLRDK